MHEISEVTPYPQTEGDQDHGSGEAPGASWRRRSGPPTRSTFKHQHPLWPGLNAEDSAICNRFFRKVRFDEDGCWTWTGSRHGDGYGLVTIRKVCRRAHRVSYWLFVGPIPDGLTLDHLCRNRACVNPDHLEPVTRRENLLRAWALRKESR